MSGAGAYEAMDELTEVGIGFAGRGIESARETEWARGRRPIARWALAAAALFLWTLGALPASALAHGAPDSFADLVQKLMPAVVNVSTTQTVKGEPGIEMPQFPPGSPFEQFFKDFLDKQQRPHKVTSLGSGFVIDPSGYIVTNNHVVADSDDVTVQFDGPDHLQLKAKVVGRDSKTDIALLKVDAGHPLAYVKFGNSDKARVGDWVVAIGNPFGLGGTVTAGILSARARQLNSGPYDDFLQTDAAINKGNSGGPMFNLDGEVIGINAAIYSPTGGSVGIGFAIPSSLAEPVVAQLEKYGKTRRGWLGVKIQTVTDEIAESMNLPKASGALVATVTPGGPAEKAGVAPGDVILKFDGRDIADMQHLPLIVAETEIGKSVPVVVWRRGHSVTLEAKVGELQETEPTVAEAAKGPEKPPTPANERKIESLGLAVAPLSADLRDQYELGAEVKGVVITGVNDSGNAAEKGLKPGDVIVELGQEQVTSPSQVARMIDQAQKAGRKSVLLLVQRAGDLRFVAVPIVKG